MSARRLSHQENPCGQVNEALIACGVLLESFSKSVVSSFDTPASEKKRKDLETLKRQIGELGTQTAVLQNRCKITKDTLKDFDWDRTDYDENQINNDINEKCKPYKPNQSTLCLKLNEILELSIENGICNYSQYSTQLTHIPGAPSHRRRC